MKPTRRGFFALVAAAFSARFAPKIAAAKPYELAFDRNAFALVWPRPSFKIGDVIHVRMPQRFITTDSQRLQSYKNLVQSELNELASHEPVSFRPV